jgi:hypothetical protein
MVSFIVKKNRKEWGNKVKTRASYVQASTLSLNSVERQVMNNYQNFINAYPLQ